MESFFKREGSLDLLEFIDKVSIIREICTLIFTTKKQATFARQANFALVGALEICQNFKGYILAKGTVICSHSKLLVERRTLPELRTLPNPLVKKLLQGYFTLQRLWDKGFLPGDLKRHYVL